ncbi:hypothetical protein KBC97_00445 [Candidatus Gracilibacteria bacterium]|nr:hypothetical protein [Candidatus Gracilibacteria bacterium]
MKKFLYFAIVALMTVGLTACFGSRDVAKFAITLRDPSGVAVLNLTPEYSKRTLTVDYKKDFSDKKQKTVDFAGQLGGEYFDRFETETKYVKNYKIPTDPYLVADPVSMTFVVEGADKTVYSMAVSPDDAQNIQTLKSFYDDILKLLTVEAPV